MIAAGDIASSESGDSATAALVAGISGTVAVLGDLAYRDGTLAEFNSYYAPTWGAFKARTNPIPGNHEYNTANAQGYRDYFGIGSGALSYSYDLAGWHVAAVDSGACTFTAAPCAPGGAVETWLRNDLAAHPAACTIVYWHHPRWSSGPHGNNSGMQGLWQASVDAGVEIVLNGHDHTYERFRPMDASGNANGNGTREFVVGTGGKALYAFSTVAPGSEVRYNATFGVLTLTLAPTSASWRFVPVSGSFADTGTTACH